MRCAIYTRVSTDEQAMSEYSSLKRQEEICRNYIDIHFEKGWKFAAIYEDAGYSGKDFQRPGIQELMEDVRAGKVDAVVTYKIDRISRSLKDFYDLWEVLKVHNVTFVSATQHFDTSDSKGMLILNILLSFAQFERELTRERTMSKMLPAREFEALIRQVLADLGNQPAILQACVDAANREAVESVTELEAIVARHREELGPLTAGIRRLIEVMKQQDLLAEDIKEEYRRLVREKEQLQTRCEKLELDLERRRKRVQDADLIRRGLQDFERLVSLLPIEDQKELFQLLVREVVVWPFEPEREAPQEPPAEAARKAEATAFATKNPHPVVPSADRPLPTAECTEPSEC